MKGLLALVAGGFGLAAYLRRRRRKGAPAESQVEPADELRATLARSRADWLHGEAPGPEDGAAEAAVGTDELDGRRRDVHDRARQAIDELG